MPLWLALLLYNLAVPWFFLLALPGWLLKMSRRGGFGTGLLERVCVYRRPVEGERQGAVAVQAVSVGEVGVAAKLIRAWLERDPEQRFLLLVGTATGRQLARGIEGERVRVVYAPLDLPGLPGCFIRRFLPQRLVLIDSEIWPNLLAAARRRSIPVSLANARLSPRSERRHRRFRPLVAPVLAMLERVGVPEPEDRGRWASIGVAAERIEVTGSVKFDPGGAPGPERRPQFTAMIGAFGVGRPVVLAASTHAGEEEWIACAVRAAAPGALSVLVPRHAERRAEVRDALEREGFEVVLRSEFGRPADPDRACLVVDTTGELRDWTAHASLVVIGKSIIGRGGQSPVDAVIAGVPFACGPWMTNFQPLTSRIIERDGCFPIEDQAALGEAVRRVIAGGGIERMVGRAREVLAAHEGATARTIAMLGGPVGERGAVDVS